MFHACHHSLYNFTYWNHIRTLLLIKITIKIKCDDRNKLWQLSKSLPLTKLTLWLSISPRWRLHTTYLDHDLVFSISGMHYIVNSWNKVKFLLEIYLSIEVLYHCWCICAYIRYIQLLLLRIVVITIEYAWILPF
jgi:hypothetical protein